MAEFAALVPVPFYPPVRTGTGSSFNFGETTRRPLLSESRVRILASEPDEGLAYSRNGHFVADTRIGWLVNIYA